MIYRIWSIVFILSISAVSISTMNGEVELGQVEQHLDFFYLKKFCEIFLYNIVLDKFKDFMGIMIGTQYIIVYHIGIRKFWDEKKVAFQIFFSEDKLLVLI